MGIEGELVWRIAVAAVLGMMLGLERSLAGKHAGMRTYALVSMGSALFTVSGILAAYQFSQFASTNPLQLAGFVIVGIGFIGSGLAVFRGEHPVELTTASGIWVVAGIGIAAGFGFCTLALAATLFGIVIFSVLARIEHWMGTRFGEQYRNKHSHE